MNVKIKNPKLIITKVRKFESTKFDELVKSQKTVFFVIPAKAGIQSFKAVKGDLDSGFRRSDDFLREHQI